MSDQPAANEDGKKSVGGELVIPIAALLFTGYYFYTIIDAPWTAQVSALFVGSILTLLVIIHLVRTYRQLKAGEIDLKMDRLTAPNAYIPKRLKLLALTIAYITAVGWLGFTITTFLFLCSAMLLLSEGKRKGLILTLSLILSVGGYFLFIVAFQTRFPDGPFEQFMKGIL
jgi:hypothetical protein